MPSDLFTLRILAEELNKKLAGGRVNKISQPLPDEAVLNINCGYDTHKLLISANPVYARCNIESADKKNPITAPNFCMLLRKHLLGGIIERVSIVENERIIKIEIVNKNDLEENACKIIYAEVMGKFSNIFLTENNIILGAMKPARLTTDSKRILLTGTQYSLPERQNKINPGDLTALEKFFEEKRDQKQIFENISGLSTRTAAESAIFANSGKEFFNFFNNPPYKPCVALQDKIPADYFVFPYKSQDFDYVYCDTLSKAVESYFADKETAALIAGKQNKLLSAVKSNLKKAEKKISIMQFYEKENAGYEQNRLKGELIISNIYKIKKGDEFAMLNNYYDEGNTKIKITLDTNLSPQQNAERYFKKYNKQKKSITQNAVLIAELSLEQQYLQSVISMINLCADDGGFDQIEEELIKNGIIAERKAKKTAPQKYACLQYSVNGFTIKVGKNNIQNEEITFSAAAHDIWLHVKNYPGSHVIINTGGKKVPDGVLLKAAEICAYFSSRRTSEKCEVDYTQKINVKKIKGAKSGLVSYTGHKTIIVSPKEHADLIQK